MLPESDLMKKNFKYNCHHSIRDGITEAQLDALNTISKKLKEEMFKEAVKRELIQNRAKQMEKLFINMNKRQQEEYLRKQYEAQMKKYLQISS